MSDIINVAAKICYPSSIEDENSMVQDVKLLVQSFRLLLPVVTIFLLGASFSIVSMGIQCGLAWYLYRLALTYYIALRSHNSESKPEPEPEPRSARIDPEKEFHAIIGVIKNIALRSINN